MHALGYEWFHEGTHPHNLIVEAYRAGFRDGRKSPEPRVFRAGDPEPGPEVGAVIDSEGDVWVRKGDARKGEDSWGVGCDGWTWVLQYGPLVGLPPLPDWLAAVKADDTGRRAAAESTGGAR